MPIEYSNSAIIKNHWFPNHKAEIINVSAESIVGEDFTIIKWHQPGTSFYSVTYIIRRNYLYVSGDIGEAVYCWGSTISPEFLAVCSLDYFAGKCQASEYGRGYKTWNGDIAYKSCISYIKDMIAEETCDNYYPVVAEDVSPEQIKAYLSKKADGMTTGDLKEACYSKYSLSRWLEDYGVEVFGQDFWELSFGEVIDIRCEGHLIGIKMAAEQLKKEGKI